MATGNGSGRTICSLTAVVPYARAAQFIAALMGCSEQKAFPFDTDRVTQKYHSYDNSLIETNFLMGNTAKAAFIELPQAADSWSLEKVCETFNVHKLNIEAIDENRRTRECIDYHNAYGVSYRTGAWSPRKNREAELS